MKLQTVDPPKKNRVQESYFFDQFLEFGYIWTLKPNNSSSEQLLYNCHLSSPQFFRVHERNEIFLANILDFGYIWTLQPNSSSRSSELLLYDCHSSSPQFIRVDPKNKFKKRYFWIKFWILDIFGYWSLSAVAGAVSYCCTTVIRQFFRMDQIKKKKLYLPQSSQQKHVLISDNSNLAKIRIFNIYAIIGCS